MKKIFRLRYRRKKSTKTVLVIEANGTSHNTRKRKNRDKHVKRILEGCGIPLLIIDTRQTSETLSKSLKIYLQR